MTANLFGKEDEVLNTLKVERHRVARELDAINKRIELLVEKRKELVERRDNLDNAMTFIAEGEHDEEQSDLS